MSVMESIAHELLVEYNIGCAKCGRTDDVHLHHYVVKDSKAARKIVGDALDILGSNVIPYCTEHHSEQHSAGGNKHDPSFEYMQKLHKLSSIQIQRRIARAGSY